MTLECTSSDDDLTLLPDDSECGSSVTSTIATCLSTYTAPSARPIELVPLNRDCYAMQILRGYDLDHVRLLFRFGIFSDSSLPRHVLRTRWKPVLGTFLSKLDQSDQPRRDVLPLSVNEMVERIERCLHFSSRHWVPLQLWIPEVMDDKEISIKINDASASVFRRIQFSDVVRQAFLEFYGPLDFAERHRGPIRGFLLWHRALKNLLYVHLSRYPSEVQKYKLIATELQNQNPFAYWAISESLAEARGSSTSVPCPDLGFLVNPLRDLFAKHNGNATALLVHLCMLEVRFGNSYLSELENDWTGPFKVEVPLYKELVVKGAWAAARMITKDDQLAFRLLSLSSIIDNDQHFRNVKRRWNDLCFAVQECATPQSGLRSCLLELAQYLRNVRNFFATTAVLQGLQRA